MGFQRAPDRRRPSPEERNPPVRDPFLKRLFGHAEVVEILISDMLPEDAGRIDFGTLEKVGTELVGEALVRRYPDMMWTARTRDGARRVLILTEFQGQQDRFMPLRTTIYCHLALQELVERTRPAPAPDSIDVLLPMVIYHGPGAWRGPTSLDELFPRRIPREFRVIFRGSERGGSGGAADLVGALASLDRERSLGGTIEALGSLRRIAERTGDRLDRLLAECIGAWLVSKGRITEDQNREATAMTQVMTEYERSLEEWAREKYAEARGEERAGVLCRLAGRRFGTDAGERLADLFGTPPDSERLSRAEEAVIECATAEELLQRVRGSSGA